MSTPSSNGETTTNRLLTLREMCAACQVSVSTGRRWVASGLIPVVLLPQANLRFRPQDVQAFINEYREGEDVPCPA